MKTKRILLRILVVLLALVMIGLILGGLWFRKTYIKIQGDYIPKNLTSVTVTDLEAVDIIAMDQMTALEEVDARGCRDYKLLNALQKRHPGVKITYTVCLDGVEYPQDATEVTLTKLTEDELALFQHLPRLAKVDARDCTDYVLLQQLSDSYPEYEVSYALPIGGREYATDVSTLTLTGATEADLEMLAYLPQLQSVHITEPAVDADKLIAAVESRPDVTFSWEKEVLGITVTSEDTELSFAGMPLEDTGELSQGLTYFPGLEKVDMSNCGIDNETMAAFREEKRSEYKVVWTVQCGKLTARTDDIFFMPVKYNVYYFHDSDAYNLRYCEDMVCIDLGHMSIKDLSFVENMPHLKYLVLAHTTVLDISPLSNCKELAFLELDWTGINDYEPLLGCTGLEDLNLGLTYGDPEIIAQMTWLKNLWWKGAKYKTQELLRQSLPDTYMMFSSSYTVGSGWRELPNYYAMRDILGMHYMK